MSTISAGQTWSYPWRDLLDVGEKEKSPKIYEIEGFC